jgi:hypothetical protein
MRSSAIAPVRTAPAATGARKLAPVSGSRSNSSDLQSDRRASAQSGARHGRRATDPVLFHSGTEAKNPLWYEQALRPVFIAQLLGQYEEPSRARTGSVPVAYRKHAREGFGPLLLDRRI